MNTTNDIWIRALELPRAERQALAQRLMESLDEPEDEVLSEAEWKAAWAEEIEARIARYERGETTARDWREALADIEKNLRKRRSS